MVAKIAVQSDKSLPKGKFHIEASADMEPLKSFAMMQGMRLSQGSCSIERSAWLMRMMSDELGLGGSLTLSIGAK